MIQRGPQGTYAFVIKPDQTVELRTVKVAQIEDGRALIDEGVEAGERVVVDGQYKLQPGSKVQVSDGQGGGHDGAPGGNGGHQHRGGGAKPGGSPAGDHNGATGPSTAQPKS